MNRTRRTTVTALAAIVLAVPALTACNLTSPSTCDAFTLTLDAGGKGGGGKSGGKGGTSKTKPKTKTGGGSSDDCDDD